MVKCREGVRRSKNLPASLGNILSHYSCFSGCVPCRSRHPPQDDFIVRGLEDASCLLSFTFCRFLYILRRWGRNRKESRPCDQMEITVISCWHQRERGAWASAISCRDCPHCKVCPTSRSFFLCALHSCFLDATSGDLYQWPAVKPHCR